MVYHLKHWAQVRDACRLDPEWVVNVAFEGSRLLEKARPEDSRRRADYRDLVPIAKECSVVETKEGFEACLLWGLEKVIGPIRWKLPLGVVDEYFRAWDKAGEEVQRLYETHEL